MGKWNSSKRCRGGYNFTKKRLSRASFSFIIGESRPAGQPAGIKEVEKIRKLVRIRFAALFLAAVLFLLTPLSPALLAAEEDGSLLREIEHYLQEYYLYPLPEGALPLDNLEDLAEVFSDAHSAYLEEEQFRAIEEGLGRYLHGIGIYMEILDSGVVVVSTMPDSPAERSGIRAGDVIEAVDGEAVADLTLAEVASLIRGEEGTRVQLQIRREESELKFIVAREVIKLPAVDYTWMEEEGFALLTVYNFDQGSGRELAEFLRELEALPARGILLDLRFNTGGYLEEALEVASLFMEGPILRMQEKAGDWKTIESARDQQTRLPVLVLLNEDTASAAEVLSAALKDSGRALLVGEVTFGKGTIQTIFPLREGGFLKLTTAEFSAPGGSIIEGSGVEPHFLETSFSKQMEMALALLESIAVSGDHPFFYLEAFLEEASAQQPVTSRPLQLQGGLYYPLRSTLARTGRTIHAAAEAGEYYFFWENRRYTLHLAERLLSWEDARGESFQEPFQLINQTSYVPVEFLASALGFPALNAQGE